MQCTLSDTVLAMQRAYNWPKFQRAVQSKQTPRYCTDIELLCQYIVIKIRQQCKGQNAYSVGSTRSYSSSLSKMSISGRISSMMLDSAWSLLRCTVSLTLAGVRYLSMKSGTGSSESGWPSNSLGSHVSKRCCLSAVCKHQMRYLSWVFMKWLLAGQDILCRSSLHWLNLHFLCRPDAYANLQLQGKGHWMWLTIYKTV